MNSDFDVKTNAAPPGLPLLITPQELDRHLGQPGWLVVDLGKAGIYAQAHVPGAIHLDPRRLLHADPATPGALPEADRLSALMRDIGLADAQHVVAYDDEGGLRAARFLWVLDMLGHRHYSLLDGGIHAWLAEERAFEVEASLPRPQAFQAPLADRRNWVEIDELLSRHRDPAVVVWDARSPEEFSGERALARRAGHVPGAAHYEWHRALDTARDLRLRDLAAIRAELTALGITPDKDVVTHCQSHQRSCFTWLLGRILGFERIRAYPGAWGEWGNRDDTPVSTGKARDAD